ALSALDAVVITRDRNGEYRIGVSDFFLQPGATPDQEHNLSAGALIVGVEVPVVPEARRSGYLKVRDRESFEFALASAAVALDITAGSVRAARVAVGGVGTVPWRLPAVERAVIGRTVSPDLWREAAFHAADGATPLSENGFKVELVKRTVERKRGTVAGLPCPGHCRQPSFRVSRPADRPHHQPEAGTGGLLTPTCRTTWFPSTRTCPCPTPPTCLRRTPRPRRAGHRGSARRDRQTAYSTRPACGSPTCPSRWRNFSDH